ncbi:MAG TPA: hypothetical protein VHK26_12295 [Methyloceanibacter sp.]|jgi:hypothetical protein|nr:hypothetical protein [Methyloceanibacter sp.]
MKTLLAALALVVAAGGLALARTDSPFYPDHLYNPTPPPLVVGGESGIPWQYRLGK